MSWHCACEESTNEEKPWAHIHIAPIDGGIPIVVVAHIECVMKWMFEEDGAIKEGCDSIHESFELLIQDAKENRKLLRYGEKFEKVMK